MSKIQVGYAPAPVSGVRESGYRRVGGVVRLVWAEGYSPRMPSDGSCGCVRDLNVRDGRRAILICERHGADPKIVDFCLKPPRNTRDPGLTP